MLLESSLERKTSIGCCFLTSTLTCLLLVSPTANAVLEGRLPKTVCGDDYQAYYDSELDVTWARNVIYTGFGTWYEQTRWANSLAIDGVSGWRLPNVDVNGDGVIVNCQWDAAVPCADNEYHFQLFRNGITPLTPGQFINFNQAGIYLTSTEYSPNTAEVWGISISIVRGVGGITNYDKSANGLAWAVRDGDIEPLTASDMVVNLATKISDLNLKRGISNSLDYKLNIVFQALEKLNANNDNEVSNMLYAFIYGVEAQRGIHITDEQANELIIDAQDIIASLAC